MGAGTRQVQGRGRGRKTLATPGDMGTPCTAILADVQTPQYRQKHQFYARGLLIRATSEASYRQPRMLTGINSYIMQLISYNGMHNMNALLLIYS